MSGKNTPKEPTRRCLKLLEQQEVAVAWGHPGGLKGVRAFTPITAPIFPGSSLPASLNYAKRPTWSQFPPCN